MSYKVLHLSKFFPPFRGGIEAVVYELAEGFNELDITTDILCSNSTRKTEHEITATGYKVTRCASLFKLLSTSISPVYIFYTKKLCAQYDIIHVHMPDPMAALALYLTRPQAKVVVHWHSDVVNQKKALKFYEPLQNWLLKRADAVIVTSQAYLDASKALARYRNKTSVIPIGITALKTENKTFEHPPIKKRFPNRKIIFALGRMSHYKGFNVLIDSAPLLRPDAIIVIGGEGELLENYRKQVLEKNLSDKVVFVGNVHDEDLVRFFEAADVFCLPSLLRSEAFGVVLLEAMAMGKPIVASDIPGSGVPWVNQHAVTGLNVPVGDSQSLAAALNLLLSDERLANALGMAGKARFQAEFQASAMIERIKTLYQSLYPKTHF